MSTEIPRQRLQDYIARRAGNAVEIRRLERLPGGAIQENWALDIRVADGEWAGVHELVLRRNAASSVAASHGRAEEFQLLRVAAAAGVKVPQPCLLCEDTDVLGGPFFIMHRADGIAAGHRVVKSGENGDLARDLARQLARIHGIKPDTPELDFLPTSNGSPALDRIEQYRAYLDALDSARPTLEWGLAWLERHAPKKNTTVLCHRDCRTGNYLVADGELTAVLDWEFAGWGDPLEDIGWFCAKCWRFGATDRDAGGIADRETFYKAYEAESGKTIVRQRVHYWEVMAHLRWAVIACQQSARHLSGEQPSLELALTGHVVPELELEILRMTKETK
ncbi:MAG: phosphotransferase family protein [Gammaproteobacteria bacterium]|nr:MAG: phosphotransferase family protein [Gammaproteobacteria bacterium]